MARASAPILVADATPIDLGAFTERTSVNVVIFFYTDAAGSEGGRILTEGDGSRNVTARHVFDARVSAPGPADPYDVKQALVAMTDGGPFALPGAETRELRELGGMHRLQFVCEQDADPIGAVSYRLVLDVEDAR